MVAEGQKSYIRKINIEGNTKTKDEVIRRELAVVPGEEFSTTKWMCRNGGSKTLATSNSRVEFFPSDTDTPGYKDISITVRERNRPAPCSLAPASVRSTV